MRYVFGIILIALTVSSCSKTEQTINIAGNNWLGYQPYYVANAFLRTAQNIDAPEPESEIQALRSNFNITSLNSTTSVMRLMSNGMLDGALLTLDEAIRFIDETDMELCIAQVVDYSSGGDAMVSKQGLFENNHNGKIRIGHESSALGGYMLRRAVEHLGLSWDDIEPVLVEPVDHVMMFEKGQVDAIISFEPFLTKLVDAGGEVSFSSRHIEKEIIDVFAVLKDSWKSNRNQYISFIEVMWAYGMEHVLQKKPSSLNLIRSNTGMDSEQFDNALQGIHLVSVEENKVILDSQLSDSIEKMSDYLIESGMINNRVELGRCE
ncbi:ABC transporter substrate-binding protein [Thiomicrorhabdus sediminis]|uniref:NitT/TauT family transport system substrate-binding protein n=1 Tax=Thiomicrorhabdus sediminis TaxID=2580412 RepID=A0A4P9K6K7_9GAMM|nr:ABC transporter substrate-binding protein [Thiomicrorhabdus sediminis]QCU89956.1 hypothetical protein FE785_04565 [Thiomicrorhabdus sediminis]